MNRGWDVPAQGVAAQQSWLTDVYGWFTELSNAFLDQQTSRGGTTLSLVNIEGWWGIIVSHVSDIDLPTSVVDSGACPDSIPPNMLGRVSSWGMAGMAMQDSSTTICYHVINGGLGAIFALMYHYFGHNHITHQKSLLFQGWHCQTRAGDKIIVNEGS